jgi:hypothetical protein
MNETQHIEHYLNDQLHPADKLLMEARLIIDGELRTKTRWQKFTYKLIKAYGQSLLKKQILTAERQIFTENKHVQFQNEINNIFRI